MDLIQAIILGIVQGLTEFLPISSSGHLLVVPAILGWKDPGAGFTAVIQIGTLAAVLIYFWRDLVGIAQGLFAGMLDRAQRETKEFRLGVGMIVGTIPIVIVGFAAQDLIDGALRSPYVAAFALAFFALLMALAEWKGSQAKAYDQITVRDSFIIGLWQCLALIPGSSRSGSTITGGLFLGFDRATAARLSFLLSVPAVLLSGGYKLVKDSDKLLGDMMLATGVATVVSFGVGYAAIAFLMKFLQTRSTMVFVVYRLILAAALVFMASRGMITG